MLSSRYDHGAMDDLEERRRELKQLHERYMSAVVMFGDSASVSHAAKRRWEAARAELSRLEEPDSNCDEGEVE